MKLPKDLIDLLSCLNAAQCEFLVVGAHALAAYGHPRYTGDLDIFFRSNAENAERMLVALKAFGFSSPQITVQSLTQPNQVHYFGRPPLRIDLLNTISGLSFDEAWEGRTLISQEGCSFCVPDLSALLRNKETAGRAKDQGDIELLRRLLAEKS